jgi:hypothetical protein
MQKATPISIADTTQPAGVAPIVENPIGGYDVTRSDFRLGLGVALASMVHLPGSISLAY